MYHRHGWGPSHTHDVALFSQRRPSLLVLLWLAIAGGLTPAITTRLLTERFHRMLWLSAGIGAATAAGGMYLSFALNAASGATIVLVGAAVFGLVLAATRRREKVEDLPTLPVHEHSHEHGDAHHFHPHLHPPHDPGHYHTH